MNEKKNISHTSLMIKSVGWYTITNFLIRSVSLFTTPIFTRLLSTSDYGIASNFSTWVSLVYCVTGLGISTAVVSGKIEFKENFDSYLSSAQALCFLFSFTVLIVCIPFLDKLSGLMELSESLVIVLFIYLLFYPSVGYMQTYYRFEYEYKKNVAISIFITIGTVVSSIALIFLWPDKRYLGRIIGNILPYFLLGIYFFARICYSGKKWYSKEYWKYSLKIGLPIIPHGLSMIVLGQIDRIMIIKMCGESYAGIYSFGYSYATIIALLTNALSDGIRPNIFEKIEDKNFEWVRMLTSKIYEFSMYVGLAMILLAPEALKLLGTSDYYDAIWVVFPIVVGSLFQFAYQNYSNLEIYYKKTHIMAIGSMLAAIINFILNALLIPRYGYYAAGYTTLFGYLFLMIFHFYGAKSVSKEAIFQFKDMILMITLSLLLGALCIITYRLNIIVRISAVIVICILSLYRFRNILIDILKRFTFDDKAMRG